MKVKKTKNGNTKIVLTQVQVDALLSYIGKTSLTDFQKLTGITGTESLVLDEALFDFYHTLDSIQDNDGW